MSDSTIRLLIQMPYQKKKYLMEVPQNCKIQIIIEKLCALYPVTPRPDYFYDIEQKRLLDGNKTFLDEAIESGSILFLI